jgi:nucleotide-binding universal stress UspA family protein
MDLGPCDVTLGFVARTEGRGVRSPLTQAEKHRRDSPRPLHLTRLELEPRARRVLGERPFALKVRLANGAVDVTLLDMASAANADLLVTGMHQWHGIGRILHSSVSRQVLRHARGNVACIPADWGA